MSTPHLLPDERLDAWVSRLATTIPGAIAVILRGSYARGDADFWSDVDFDVLIDDTDIDDAYLTWFEETGERSWHISVAVEHLSAWLEEGTEPADWALGFPATLATRLLWTSRPSLRAELDRPHRLHPAGEPELEDTFESLGKARNALGRGDDLTARLALRDLGHLLPSLLIPLNPPTTAGTKPEALRLALNLPIAPDRYHDDLLALLGFDGHAHTAAALLVTAERLLDGTITLLEQHIETIAPLLAPHLDQYLRDGTLRRYLSQ